MKGIKKLAAIMFLAAVLLGLVAGQALADPIVPPPPPHADAITIGK